MIQKCYPDQYDYILRRISSDDKKLAGIVFPAKAYSTNENRKD